jgi:maltose O-acetyltransferase
MFTKFITHIRLRAQQEKANNVLSWAVDRFLARAGNDLFIFFWHLLFAWLPSLPGRWVRRVVLKAILAECGRGLQIGENVHIEYPRRIRLGNNVWFGRKCHISAPGGITLGNDVLIAHDSCLETAGHDIDPKKLFREARIIYGPITIGNNTWLGTRTTVLYNTTIGSNVVVAAGAVVNKDIPDNVIYGGIPARKIRDFVPEITQSEQV